MKTSMLVRSSALALLLGAALTLAGCKAQELPAEAPVVITLQPQAIADVAVVQMDSAANTIAVLANDLDPAGDGLTVTAVSVEQAVPPLAGAVATTDGDTVSFTPAANFVGVVVLSYAVVDGAGKTSSSVVAVTVLPLVPPPVALPDVSALTQDSGATDIDVLANDIDFSAGGLTLSGASVTASLPLATHAISVVGNKVRFTPAAGFIGVVAVGYTATDVNGSPALGVLTIVVSPLAVLQGPVPVPDAVVLAQNSAATDVDVLANDVDPAAGGLTLGNLSVTASLPTSPAHGLAVAGNKLRFTPATGFFGSVLVGYTATDVNGHSASGVLTVVVSPLALAQGPVPVPDALVVTQNSGATDVNVLANDIDPAAGGLTLSNVSVTAAVPNVAQGLSVVANKLRFTPAAGFVGSVVVAYTATDINGNSAPGVMTVVVSPLALAIGPVPVPDAAVVTQDSGAADIAVLANDVDPAGGGLTLGGLSVTASAPTATHTLAVVGNKVRFTPAAGFAGAVVVAYTATDVNGTVGNGVLSIVVTPTALAIGPVPLPDVALVSQNSSATDIDVLANDVSLTGSALTLSNLSVTASVPTAVHSLAVAGNKLRFVPAAGFAGAVVVSYRATDVSGNFASGVATITVSPLNPVVGFVALPDAAVLAQDASASDINVLVNDVDVAGGGLTLTGASVLTSLPSAAHAVSIVGNKVRFTPAAGFAGVVVVSYSGTDANGQVGNGLLDITVTPAALTLPPVALPDVAIKSSSLGATSINVLANDVDPAGGGLTLTQVSILTQLPSGAGTVTIVGNQVRYTPSALYVGAVLVSYTATDVNGQTTTGQLSLTVTL